MIVTRVTEHLNKITRCLEWHKLKKKKLQYIIIVTNYCNVITLLPDWFLVYFLLLNFCHHFNEYMVCIVNRLIWLLAWFYYMLSNMRIIAKSIFYFWIFFLIMKYFRMCWHLIAINLYIVCDLSLHSVFHTESFNNI